MTTTQQQIDFIAELRENYDNNERLRITSSRSNVAELLRDIQDSLYGVKLWELNQHVEFCDDCHKPLTPANKVCFAVADGKKIVERTEHVCDRCTDMRMERMNTTAGIP